MERKNKIEEGQLAPIAEFKTLSIMQSNLYAAFLECIPVKLARHLGLHFSRQDDIQNLLDAKRQDPPLHAGPNPARWKRHLQITAPLPPHERKHHPALRWQLLPELLRTLRQDPQASYAAVATEFCILTATRNKDVAGARWEEVDFAKAIWTIPACRHKSKKNFTVPLPRQALALLTTMYQWRSNAFVFEKFLPPNFWFPYLPRTPR
jgi:integrase